MNAREIPVGYGSSLIDYRFDSMLEMLDFVEDAKVICHGELSSKTGGYSFTGTNSIGEAIDMCRNGYFSKDVENFQKIFFKIANQIDKKLKNCRIKNDVVGGTPDVPRYLIGHPLNMFNVDIKERGPKPKKICLRFNTAISAGTSKDYIEKRGLTFVLLFDFLRKLGCPVELQTVEFCSYDSDDIYSNVEVLLMKNNDMMNISKIYFPLVHPSYLRRIMFAVEERIPELEAHQGFFFGYGRPESFRKYIDLTGEDAHQNEINVFSDDYNYQSIGGALKNIVRDIGNQGGLKTSTESVMQLLDSIDFSKLGDFQSGSDYDDDYDLW